MREDLVQCAMNAMVSSGNHVGYSPDALETWVRARIAAVPMPKPPHVKDKTRVAYEWLRDMRAALFNEAFGSTGCP